jgi:YgiT-type zinc finger domain-containing protein
MNECFECSEGRYYPRVEDHVTYLKDIGEFVVPNIAVEKCDKCGATLFDADACDEIDAAIEAAYPNYFRKHEKESEKIKKESEKLKEWVWIEKEEKGLVDIKISLTPGAKDIEEVCREFNEMLAAEEVEDKEIF